MPLDVNRREVMKWLSAAVFAPLALPAPDPTAPLYFSKDQYQLLDTLTELIIPADDHSPGAHDAGVAAFIDKSVAQAFLPEEKTSWQKGLAGVNTLAHSMHNQPFLELDKDNREASFRSCRNPKRPEKRTLQTKGIAAKTV